MSDPMRASEATGRRRPRWGRVATVAWLVVVWVALWGGLSWANVGSGVLVAVVVLALFPTGPGTGVRISPWPALRYVVWFAGQLVVATAQVVVAAVAPAGRVRPAVVAVPLRSRSALVTTIVANSVTLTPGTLTVDVESAAPVAVGAPEDADHRAGRPPDERDERDDRDEEAIVDGDDARVLLVHALDAADPDAVRASVLAFEARAVAAFGTSADRAALAAATERAEARHSIAHEPAADEPAAIEPADPGRSDEEDRR